MKDTTAIGAGLFAAWATNDVEELITMAETSRTLLRRAPAWLPISPELRARGLSQAHVNLSIGLMGCVVAAASIAGIRSKGRSAFFRGGLYAFGLHGFGHIASSLAVGGYTTGVATSPTVVIPYWFAARKVLKRHGLRDDDRAASRVAWAALPITVAVHLVSRAVLGRRSIAR